MPLPGFTVDDEVVGRKLSFDAIRLEDYLDSASELRATDGAIEQVGDVIHQYCERKPEICNALSGGSNFYLTVYEGDVEIISKLLAKILEFRKYEPVHGFRQRKDDEAETVTYEEILQGADIDVELDDVSWDDLSDESVDVDAAIREKIPDGIENLSFSSGKFREFVFKYVKPAVDEGGWQGGNAWLINLGLHELRNGNYEEASYAFDGARLGLTKRPIFEGESSLHKYFNSCLVSLRQLCAYHDSPEKRRREHELFISMDDRPFVFVPKFLSEPDLGDRNFRFSNNIWIANALVLVAAVANAMDPPTVSRSEVDPFGTNTTAKNNYFVLKAARRLFNLDEYDSWEEWSADQNGESLPHLKSIDFTELAPEIIVTRIFSEVGFDIRNYGGETLKYGDDQELDIAYDSLLFRNNCFYLVKLVDGDTVEDGDVKESVSEIEEVDQDVTLFLLSGREYSESIIDYAEEVDELNLYYLDIDEESIRSVHSGGEFHTRDLTIPSGVLEDLAELYAAAESEDDSQEKGDLLEELMERIFEQLIPDTNVLDTNVRTASEEIDLILRNREITFPWKTLGTPIQVECKNWSSAAGTNIVKVLKGDMESIGPMCKTGILVSWEGISDGNPRRDAAQKIREYRQKNIKILVLDKDDISELVETGDAKRIFEEKHKELITR